MVSHKLRQQLHILHVLKVPMSASVMTRGEIAFTKQRRSIPCSQCRSCWCRWGISSWCVTFSPRRMPIAAPNACQNRKVGHGLLNNTTRRHTFLLRARTERLTIDVSIQKLSYIHTTESPVLSPMLLRGNLVPEVQIQGLYMETSN